jgi:cell wall-associated NlpC family hydrolase
MTARHTRWMRRTALLACLLGAAVLGGGYLAIGAAGDESRGTRSLTGDNPSAKAYESTAKLPPLPKKLRARVVQPEAGAATPVAPAAEPEQDPGLDDPGPKPTEAASSGGRRPSGLLGEGSGAGTSKATALSNGVALPPFEAPEAVRQIIEAGNSIARTPYKWGGGHGKWQDTGYDCSGSVSFALAAAGLLDAPLASGPLMSWGKPGKGKWVTIYSNPGHVYLEVAGIRFDTSGARATGSRWQNELRSHEGYVARHPPNL